MSDNLPTTSTSRRDDDGGAPSPATHDGTITESTSEDAPKKPKPWFKRLSLTTWIFIALILGVLAGLALQGAPDIADTYIKPFGTIFLNLIKMIVVPLVLFSIIAGVVSLDDVKKVGAIGGKTILFYLVTTGFAVTLGLIFANVMNVGAGYVMDTQDLSYEATDPPSFIDTIVNIFPSNFFQPMADATMLQVIVIAVVFGFGMIAAGKKAKPVIDICNALSDVCIAIMRGIILVAPFGVFGLICPVIANNGIDVLRPLLWLIVVAYVAMICQIALVYSGIIKVFARMSPLKSLRGEIPVLVEPCHLPRLTGDLILFGRLQLLQRPGHGLCQLRHQASGIGGRAQRQLLHLVQTSRFSVHTVISSYQVRGGGTSLRPAVC